MRSNWHRALLVSFVLIMSSLAGCIGTDDEDELEEGQYGTVMVSTYHVGEIVKAIAGDTVDVPDDEPKQHPCTRLFPCTGRHS